MSGRPHVLVTRRIPSSVVERLRTHLEVDQHDGADDLSRGELLRRVAGKQALMAVLTNAIDGELLDAGRDLRIVANIAVGYDNVDVAAAAARGIIVTNTPDVLTEAVADFTMALILAVTRRVGEGERLLRAGAWRGWALDFMLGMELRDKQLGLIGYGRIGQAVARRAAAFGMRIAYTDTAARGGALRLSLDELLVSSDVVSLHVPLSSKTRHLVDRKALARMKRSAYLVNTSRGPIVDEAALAWALGEHLIAGAALDVFEREPLIHEGLLGLENVVLVPHLGSATRETRTAMADLAARNVIAVLNGEPPLTPVAAAPTTGTPGSLARPGGPEGPPRRSSRTGGRMFASHHSDDSDSSRNRRLIRGAVLAAAVVALGLVLLVSTWRTAVPVRETPPTVKTTPSDAGPTPEATTPETTSEPTDAASRSARRRARPDRPEPVSEAPPEAAPAHVLRIESDVAGATVFVDRQYLGTTPLETTAVAPGSHQLNGSAEGHDGLVQMIDVAEAGPTTITLRFREVRLDASVDVVHKHAMGSCSGNLRATTAGLRYDTSNKNDAFTLPFAAIDLFEVDYLQKNLRVKQRGGRTWNFTEPSGDADKLFVFHRDVTKARDQMIALGKRQ